MILEILYTKLNKQKLIKNNHPHKPFPKEPNFFFSFFFFSINFTQSTTQILGNHHHPWATAAAAAVAGGVGGGAAADFDGGGLHAPEPSADKTARMLEDSALRCFHLVIGRALIRVAADRRRRLRRRSKLR